MTEKQYYSQITRYGTQVINECLSSIDKKLIASDWYIAIGTGDLIPTEDTEELINPIYDKNSANYVGISFGTDPNYGRFAKIIVPEEIQGSIIKELGLFDGNNKLICAAKTYADLSQKLSDGLAYDYSLTLYLQAIPSDVEIVYINPNAMATIEEVENKIDEKIGDIDFSSFEVKANKGQANGYCPLDKDELVPKKHLPEINNTTITTYHNVVYGVAKTLAFGGNYSSFAPVDISSYADGTYYVYKIDTTDEETQEVTSSISITTTENVAATQLAKIVIANGNVTEVQDSLQYTTETPLQEVTVHTEASWNATNEVDDSELNLVSHTFVDVDYVNPKTVPANTDCSYNKDGVYEVGSSAIATITVTKNGVTREFYGTSRKIKAGVHFKSSLAGKFYYFEGQ